MKYNVKIAGWPGMIAAGVGRAEAVARNNWPYRAGSALNMIRTTDNLEYQILQIKN